MEELKASAALGRVLLGPLDHLRVWLVSFGGGSNNDVSAELGSGYHEGVGNVISITDIDYLKTLNPALLLEDSLVVSEGLARV